MGDWNGLSGIDLAGLEEDKGGSSLPAGAHICVISKAEVGKTKNNKGHRLAVTLTSLDGAGQVVDYMNIHNSSAEAQEIGQRRLKTLLVRAGYSHPTPDIAKMKGLKVGVHVVQGADWHDDKGERRKGGGEPRSSNPYFAPSGQPASSPASSPAAPSGSDGFDDDIPFRQAHSS